MLGQLPTFKDFWTDKSPWSEDLKWISLSTTMGKCPFSIMIIKLPLSSNLGENGGTNFCSALTSAQPKPQF